MMKEEYLKCIEYLCSAYPEYGEKYLVKGMNQILWDMMKEFTYSYAKDIIRDVVKTSKWSPRVTDFVRAEERVKARRYEQLKVAGKCSNCNGTGLVELETPEIKDGLYEFRVKQCSCNTQRGKGIYN